MVSKCGVCVDAQSKYKCPTCLTPYCSLPCYRAHKEVPCSKASEPPAPSRDDEEASMAQPPRSFEENEDESGWRLHRRQLEALACSDDIRSMLRDDALRTIIQKVDSSITPEKDLDEAMQGSAFKEFTDKILAMAKADEHLC